MVCLDADLSGRERRSPEWYIKLRLRQTQCDHIGGASATRMSIKSWQLMTELPPLLTITILQMRVTPVALLAVAAVAATPAKGGPLAYAACQTGEYLPVHITKQR